MIPKHLDQQPYNSFSALVRKHAPLWAIGYRLEQTQLIRLPRSSRVRHQHLLCRSRNGAELLPRMCVTPQRSPQANASALEVPSSRRVEGPSPTFSSKIRGRTSIVGPRNSCVSLDLGRGNDRPRLGISVVRRGLGLRCQTADATDSGSSALPFGGSCVVWLYQAERPHQGLGGVFIQPSNDHEADGPLVRRERLGGLLNDYYREAA